MVKQTVGGSKCHWASLRPYRPTGHRRLALTDDNPFPAQSRRGVTESAVMAEEIEALTDRAGCLKLASEPVRMEVSFRSMMWRSCRRHLWQARYEVSSFEKKTKPPRGSDKGGRPCRKPRSISSYCLRVGCFVM